MTVTIHVPVLCNLERERELSATYCRILMTISTDLFAVCIYGTIAVRSSSLVIF